MDPPQAGTPPAAEGTERDPSLPPFAAGDSMLEPTGIRHLPPSDYGYVRTDGVPVPVERDELLRVCLGDPRPVGVWTPETEGVVPPWQVPWIFTKIMEPVIQKSWEQVKGTGFLFGMGLLVGGLALSSDPGAARSGPPLLLVVAGIWLGQALLDWHRMRKMTPADVAAEVEEARTLPRARSGPPMLTRALAAIIVVIAVAQSLSPGVSYDAAGLVKSAVRAGEWWRLFTAPLLHVGLMHLGFNAVTLLALGGLIERYAHRVYVPLVFLLTALAGGLGSLALYPDTRSVGASGGIMGLVGFALVLSLRRRSLLPRSLTHELLADVGWVAVMGLAAYQYIDNAAHGAGLLAGALLGLLLVPRGGTTPHWEPSPVIRAAGWAALAGVAASALAAIAAMWGRL
ncbi:MAG TPA: rhomboid family intramembrane serine protease [Longimicrobium sp.]